MSPLVEIGLTDLPKSGCAMAPPAPSGLATNIEKEEDIFNTSLVRIQLPICLVSEKKLK